MEQTVLNIFISNLEQDIADLEQHFKAQNYKAWDEIAHKLYGASSHIEAERLANACDYAQTLFPEKVENILEAHKAILNEYAHVHEFLITRKAAAA